MEPLILASRSPRRCELLQRLGLPFETDHPDVDERCDLPAGDAVRFLSSRKAAASAASHTGRFVLAADTLVSLDGLSLGKPRNEADAVHMLQALSGKTHQVYTGVTVISPAGKSFTAVDRTDVNFAVLTENPWTRQAPTPSRDGPASGRNT